MGFRRTRPVHSGQPELRTSCRCPQFTCLVTAPSSLYLSSRALSLSLHSIYFCSQSSISQRQLQRAISFPNHTLKISLKMPPKPPEQKHIIILGAGITALSTALSLRLSPTTSHYTQTIIASHLPGDVSIAYTSPNAGGHWRSFASLSNSESEIRKWDKRTYESWMAILENGYAGEEEVGLGIRESRK